MGTFRGRCWLADNVYEEKGVFWLLWVLLLERSGYMFETCQTYASCAPNKNSILRKRYWSNLLLRESSFNQRMVELIRYYNVRRKIKVGRPATFCWEWSHHQSRGAIKTATEDIEVHHVREKSKIVFFTFLERVRIMSELLHSSFFAMTIFLTPRLIIRVFDYSNSVCTYLFFVGKINGVFNRFPFFSF